MLCSLLLLDFFTLRNLRGFAERHIFPEQLIFRGNHFVLRRPLRYPLLLTWLLSLLLV